MIYGNVFLQNNIIEEDIKPMSLEEQVEFYKDVIESLLLSNINDDDILNEVTKSGFEYTTELRNMNKQIRPITKEFSKAYKEKDKKTCLKKLREIEDILDKSKTVVDKIKPDVSDTVISILFNFMKLLVTCVLVTPFVARSKLLIEIVGFGIGFGNASINLPSYDNNYQMAAKGHTQWNTFRNRYFTFFKYYKDWIKTQRKNINKF